jgi:hypothetical protein
LGGHISSEATGPDSVTGTHHGSFVGWIAPFLEVSAGKNGAMKCVGSMNIMPEQKCACDEESERLAFQHQYGPQQPEDGREDVPF